MLVVCGEALVDLVRTAQDTYVAHPGGSPGNVAVGLARLGVPTSWLGRLSGDGFGRRLREHLTRNGVDLSLAASADEPTTLAVATVDALGGAEYEFYLQGTADWQWRSGELPDPLPTTVTALHTGSLAAAVPPGAAAVETLLARERDRDRVVLSFDPNIRPRLEPDAGRARARVERQVRLVHVVKASADDVHFLYPDDQVEKVARGWLAAGPTVVVVTDGGAGARAFTAEAVWEVRSRPVDVVDTVGAGDAFSAGMLAWLHDAGALHDRPADLATIDLPAMLRFATDVAALTCTRPGADPPRRDALSPPTRLP